MIFRKLINFLVRELRYCIWFFAAYFPQLPSWSAHIIRPCLWKWIGVRLGKNVFIGYGVYLDVDGGDLIEVEDNVLIAAQCLLLTHRRNIGLYRKGMLQNELSYIRKPIVIEKNASIGMRSIIMPGVTIGEGAVVAAGSIVTRDIPPHTIAAGSPAKVIKNIE